MPYPTPSTYTKPIRPVQDASLGYLYFMDSEHPLSDAKGRVWHHRHVASVALGRWIMPYEIVHHRDEVRSHNDPQNFEVKSQAEHAAEHAREATLRRGGFPGRVDNCATCGQEYFRPRESQRYCSPACYQRTRRKFHPTQAELQSLLAAYPMTHIARQYGVSETAVRKHKKRLGL